MASKAIVVINFRMIGLRVRGPFTFHGSGETRPQGVQTSRFVQMFQLAHLPKPPGQLGGFFLASIVIDWGRNEQFRRLLDALMNDDQSPLTTLISCMVCSKTMKFERISPDGEGDDLLQYRCGQCNRIERLRLLRGRWP
jgi:hypothetical protein